jgi:hypothetical protein
MTQEILMPPGYQKLKEYPAIDKEGQGANT